MNSTYGKFGWDHVHEICNYVTADSAFLLEQYRLGNVSDVRTINERYTQYSGRQLSETKRTNFMLTSYITARSRRRLIQALYQFEKAGLIPCYSDTDSIYVHFPEDYSKQKFEQYVRPLLNDNILGAFKDETYDDCGSDFVDACFVSCKLYALRNPNDHSRQVIKARGIPEYFAKDDLEGKNAQRRMGANKITFNDIAGLL